LDVELGNKYQALQAQVADFAKTEVAPAIAELYERAEFPYEIVAKMGKLGLFGLPFPIAYGGAGLDSLALCLAVEQLATVDSSVAITLGAGVCLGAMPIYRFGTEGQKQTWLPRLCQGEVLGAFASTEPATGSDISAVQTTARREESCWVVNGVKAFITNSGTEVTGFVTVNASTGQRPDGRPLVSAIIVPARTAGFRVSRSYSKVGWPCSDTNELTFSDCRVPLDNLLGEEGRGHALFLEILVTGRVAVAALGAGLARGCVDECLRYMSKRVVFGHKIAEFEALQFKLADMEARAHVAHLAWLDAAQRLVAGQDAKKQASIAKLVASDAAVKNARDATQIFGAYGFLNESPVGRFYRDAKILEIGEGTSEIQRIIIARELGLPA
jgi:short/branched chain acyl-CoA dehydrogenase